jgi:hypothetical protein
MPIGYTPADLYGPATRFTPGELGLPSATPGGQATGVGNGTDRAGQAGTRRQDRSPSGAGGKPISTNNKKDSAETIVIKKSLKDAVNVDTLYYPRNAAGYNYLIFEIFNYKAASALEVNDIRQGLIKGGSGLTQFLPNFEGEDTQSGLTTGNNNNNPTANSGKGKIFLYVPPRLEYNYGAGWNKVSFGLLGAAIGNGGLDVFTSLAAGASQAANNFTNDILNQAGNIPKTEGISLDSVIGGAFGVTFNDNTLQTFDRMSTRSFNFEYVMLARNATEEADIKNIILKFKHAMHPGAKRDNSNVSLFLDYPYIFRITPATSKNNIHEYIPKTKYCALTRMSVDYTPNNTFNPTPGSFVHAVRLSLAFEELTTLTQLDLLNDTY